METKIVMRYKREKAAWICWNCEMENEISGQECYFCRAKRDNARIVKSWAEEAAIDSYAGNAPGVSSTDAATGYATRADLKPAAVEPERKLERSRMDEEFAPAKESSVGPILLWTVLLILIVLIIVVVCR